MVPSTRSPSWLSPLFHGYRHVVCRLHLCGDGLQRSTSVSWRLRDRSNIQDFQVKPCHIACSLMTLIIGTSCRILGTPNEDNWPGVRQLPDYKSTFPQWSQQDLCRVVPQLDEAGVDILSVNQNIIFGLLLVLSLTSYYSYY